MTAIHQVVLVPKEGTEVQVVKIGVPIQGDERAEEKAARWAFEDRFDVLSAQRLGLDIPKYQQFFTRVEAAAFLGESPSVFDARCKERGIVRADNARTFYPRELLEEILATKTARKQ